MVLALGGRQSSPSFVVRSPEASAPARIKTAEAFPINEFSLAYSAYQSDTGVVIPVYRIGDAHALIALRVFLRLTAMDVCCGPPTLR